MPEGGTQIFCVLGMLSVVVIINLVGVNDYEHCLSRTMLCLMVELEYFVP